MHSTIEGEDKHVESRLIPRLDESSNLSTSTPIGKKNPLQSVDALTAHVILRSVEPEESFVRIVGDSSCSFGMTFGCHAER